MMKYVILGNSAAAIGCVEGIRQIDKTGEILIVSQETEHTYSRPLISYLLLGKTDLERMKYRPASFYKENNCEVLLGVKAEKILPDKKTVRFSDGQEVAYDKLLVATGSKPFVPPVPGLERVDKKFTFMSLDDAQSLGSVLTPQTRVLIMGAGLIGLKCAEGILKSAGSITVVDLADRILPSILDQKGAGIIKTHLEKLGLKFVLGDSVESFEPNSAKLKSGKTIDFDVLVVAVGVRPNTELVSEAGGDVNKGIVTDYACETSLADVYAAGDCSESFDITIGEKRILALLPNAYMQGECAGINMAGGSAEYKNAIPMNAIGFMGLHIISAGSYTGNVYEKSDGKNYKLLFYKENLLKGFILIGDVARAGIYTSLIREMRPLDTIDFELIKDKPQLMAFAKKDRSKLLGA